MIGLPSEGPSLGTTQPTATITSTEDLRRVAFTTPPQTALGTNSTEPPPSPIRKQGPELGADNLTTGRVANELAPSDFVSQKLTRLGTLMQDGNKKRSKPETYRPDLTLVRRRKLKRSGKTMTGASEFDRWAIADVQSRLGQRRSRVKVSSSDSEDSFGASAAAEYREDEDMSLPWRRQKVDAFARRISDFSEDKRRLLPVMPPLKLATNPCALFPCHMFNSTLVGNDAELVQHKLPPQKLDDFEELRWAFRLNS
ncbi:hypothetical protein Tco_1253264 [Tanacetum coccineum]